ncbi:MAG: hypothetical protein H7Y59_09720 [Anaerolineales bacterium]|nr:hypothetical protein [Anaerolineales bacterium]
MNFDIVEVFTRAWKITWKHKVLWIFGILASCGRSSGGNSNSSNNNDYQSGGDQASREMIRQLSAFMEKVMSWVTENPWIVIAFVIFILILWVIQIFLSTTGGIGLIRGVYHAEMGVEKLNFGELFRESLRYFWRVIGMGLIIFAPFFIVFFGMFAILLLSARSAGSDMGDVFGGVFILFFIAFCCCLIPFMIALGLYVTQASRALILEDLGVFASLARGWEVFRKNIVGLLIMAVILFLINAIIGIAIAIPVYIAIFPIMFSFLEGNINSWQPFILAGVFVLLYSPVAWFLTGILLTYTETIWTLIYIRVTQKREEAPVMIEANA